MNSFDGQSDPQAHVDLGMEHLSNGRTDQAIAAFNQAISVDPNHAQALFCKGTLLQESGQLEAAIECYGRSAKHAGDHAALPLYNMGNAFQELGEFDRALKCFQLATEVDPEMADAWINSGRLLDDRGLHQEAIECYETALQLEPEDSVAWSNRGNSLRSQRRFEEALASYQQALQYDSMDTSALTGIGVCLGNQDKPEKGLEFIEQGLSIVPHPHAMVEQATLLSQLERNDEALQALDRAIDFGVDACECWNNRGEVLAKLDRENDAIASFDKALEQDPHFAPSWLGKARVLARRDELAAAKTCLERYFEHASDDDPLREDAEQIYKICN